MLPSADRCKPTETPDLAEGKPKTYQKWGKSGSAATKGAKKVHHGKSSRQRTQPRWKWTTFGLHGDLLQAGGGAMETVLGAAAAAVLKCSS